MIKFIIILLLFAFINVSAQIITKTDEIDNIIKTTLYDKNYKIIGFDIIEIRKLYKIQTTFKLQQGSDLMQINFISLTNVKDNRSNIYLLPDNLDDYNEFMNRMINSGVVSEEYAYMISDYFTKLISQLSD